MDLAWSRAPRRTAAVVAAVTMLGACVPTSPGGAGLTGLTLNAEGRLTVAVTWCGPAPDPLAVHRRSGHDLVDQAELKGPALPRRIAFVDLEKLPDGWVVSEGSLSLREEQSYAIAPYRSRRQLTYFPVNLKAGHKTRRGPHRDSAA